MKTSELLNTKNIAEIIEFVEGFLDSPKKKEDVTAIIEEGVWDGNDLVFLPSVKRAAHKNNAYTIWFDAKGLKTARRMVESNVDLSLYN